MKLKREQIVKIEQARLQILTMCCSTFNRIAAAVHVCYIHQHSI